MYKDDDSCESCWEEHVDHRREVGVEAVGYFHGPVDVERFLGDCFPNWTAPGVASGTMKKFRAELAKINPQVAQKRVEKKMYPQIDKVFTYVCANQHLPLQIHICADERQKESQQGYRIAPDLAILKSDEEYSHWARSIAFIEVKRTAKDDPLYGYDPGMKLKMNTEQVNNWTQIQEYAVSAFRSVPRCFLLAIGIFGDMARLFRWDRSSVIVSRSFPYKTQPEPLLKFVIGLALYANGGTDATLTAPVLEAERELVSKAYRRGQEDNLLPPGSYQSDPPGCSLAQSSQPLFCSKSIFGRGTRVWIATKICHTDDGDAPMVVIKDYWRESHRWAEGDVYRAIYRGRTKSFGVARFSHDYDIDDSPDDTVHRSSGARINQGIAKILPSPAGNQKDRQRFKELVHHRVILLSIGIPIWRFKSTKILLESIRDAIIGHNNMCEQGVLHRDISTSNIMISADVKAEDGAKGFIIDPEYAVDLRAPGADDLLCNLTGTFQYTAMALFRATVQHDKWHDLESFFWVVVEVILKHTACFITINSKILSGSQAVALIFTTSFLDRQAFVDYYVHTLTVSNNVPLTKCIKKFSALVATHYPNTELLRGLAFDDVTERLDGKVVSQSEMDQLVEAEFSQRMSRSFYKLTHSTVISTIEDALNTEGWPDEEHDGAVPFILLESPAVKSNAFMSQELERSTVSLMQSSVEAEQENRGQAQTQTDEPSPSTNTGREICEQPGRSSRLAAKTRINAQESTSPVDGDSDGSSRSKRPRRGCRKGQDGKSEDRQLRKTPSRGTFRSGNRRTGLRPHAKSDVK
ncbi:hypothetical protein NEOLEDRAFT_149396 [Neolentinus lepideus HHB14362 ss-1]|uniref:Fungal-type protein kinase domain-containing protein n=1 Tax=Neolentinus lepideus HHB14362 ss-1 TaxID=1314782 RepID=A0A165MNE9_9AGAM|nr:hypothetical protein NEOLEDRAFT_149396 [Neolentinus lepideus HHB14362 ss-1]